MCRVTLVMCNLMASTNDLSEKKLFFRSLVQEENFMQKVLHAIDSMTEETQGVELIVEAEEPLD